MFGITNEGGESAGMEETTQKLLAMIREQLDLIEASDNLALKRSRINLLRELAEAYSESLEQLQIIENEKQQKRIWKTINRLDGQANDNTKQPA